MNHIVLIGNLTRPPELRTTSTGISVCTFTIAVNRKKSANQDQEADFFRVTAWRQLGELCQKYLAKGRKVCVVGSVAVSTYEGKDGKTYANLEVTADQVEFLTPRGETGETATAPSDGFIEVEEDCLPF